MSGQERRASIRARYAPRRDVSARDRRTPEAKTSQQCLVIAGLCRIRSAPRRRFESRGEHERPHVHRRASRRPTRARKPPADRRTAVRREPLLAPPADVLQRYNARVLDPTTAMVVAGQAPIRPTVYIADRLIVSGQADQSTRGALQEAARRLGLALVLDEKGTRPESARRGRPRAAADRPAADPAPARAQQRRADAGAGRLAGAADLPQPAPARRARAEAGRARPPAHRHQQPGHRRLAVRLAHGVGGSPFVLVTRRRQLPVRRRRIGRPAAGELGRRTAAAHRAAEPPPGRRRARHRRRHAPVVAARRRAPAADGARRPDRQRRGNRSDRSIRTRACSIRTPATARSSPG